MDKKQEFLFALAEEWVKDLQESSQKNRDVYFKISPKVADKVNLKNTSEGDVAYERGWLSFASGLTKEMKVKVKLHFQVEDMPVYHDTVVELPLKTISKLIDNSHNNGERSGVNLNFTSYVQSGADKFINGDDAESEKKKDKNNKKPTNEVVKKNKKRAKAKYTKTVRESTDNLIGRTVAMKNTIMIDEYAKTVLKKPLANKWKIVNSNPTDKRGHMLHLQNVEVMEVKWEAPLTNIIQD